MHMCKNCGFNTEAKGTEKINEFMRGIYQHDVFIPGPEARRLADALYVFIKAYIYEAHACYERDVSAFGLYPKLHALDEVRHAMIFQVRTAGFCLNPAIYVCSIDEDFIGRTAAVTRCVSPKLLAQRTLQRYLVHIQIAWSRWWYVLCAHGKEQAMWILDGWGMVGDDEGLKSWNGKETWFPSLCSPYSLKGYSRESPQLYGRELPYLDVNYRGSNLRT